MAVKSYNKSIDGNKSLSPDFKVSEFACKDGSNTILISDELVKALQKVRDYFKKPIIISSAYRTASYNAKIGGASRSQHVLGTAADIRISGVSPRDIAIYLEKTFPSGGQGLYDYAANDKPGFNHIDVRAGKARWYRTKSSGQSDTSVSSITIDYLQKKVSYPAANQNNTNTNNPPTIKKGSTGQWVKTLQTELVNRFGNGLKVDGDFGTLTEIMVRAFQIGKGISNTGIVDSKTWTALRG